MNGLPKVVVIIQHLELFIANNVLSTWRIGVGDDIYESGGTGNVAKEVMVLLQDGKLEGNWCRFRREIGVASYFRADPKKREIGVASDFE